MKVTQTVDQIEWWMTKFTRILFATVLVYVLCHQVYRDRAIKHFENKIYNDLSILEARCNAMDVQIIPVMERMNHAGREPE